MAINNCPEEITKQKHLYNFVLMTLKKKRCPSMKTECCSCLELAIHARNYPPLASLEISPRTILLSGLNFFLWQQEETIFVPLLSIKPTHLRWLNLQAFTTPSPHKHYFFLFKLPTFDSAYLHSDNASLTAWGTVLAHYWPTYKAHVRQKERHKEIYIK